MAFLLPNLFDSSSSDDENTRRRNLFEDRYNPFDELNDSNFRKRFRLSKDSILNLLEILEPSLAPANNKNNPIPALIQILITLRFYATGSFQLSIADYFKVSQPTVSRIVKKVTEQIAALRPRYIKFPQGIEECREVAQGFYAMGRKIPRIIGAVDCSHIKILSPGGDEAEIFRNRKGYFSINVQAICDSNLKILDIIARWPGSTHDMTIFDDSLIRARFEANEFQNFYLLGDNGYANRNYLLTPLLTPITNREKKYNRCHILMRNTIERTFGVVKRRFPCLSIGLNVNVNTVLKIIVATSVLHNICVEFNDLEIEDDDEVVVENEDHFDVVSQPSARLAT